MILIIKMMIIDYDILAIDDKVFLHRPINEILCD